MNAGTMIRARYALRREDFALDIDLELPMRGITGVFGVSGAGKTTLLRCIAGLERADGLLVVAGETWQDSAAGEWRAVANREVGYVFQEPRLFDHLSVRDNIDYGRKRRHAGVNADHIIELLGLTKLLQRKPHDLSGGEAQRVAIARALSCAPRFVLMDEPLASLDQARKNEILPYLDRLHAESEVPVIYVSHNIDEVCRLCDHLVVIDDGVVRANGPLQSVLVDLDVSQLADEHAGSILEGKVANYDATDGLTELECSAGRLLVPGRAGETGSELRLRIRASDVSLCRTVPQETTILNVLPAVVESIGEAEGPVVLVRLALGRDRILARVTRRSVRELNLQVGDEVFAQIKSVAVRSPYSLKSTSSSATTKNSVAQAAVR